MALILGREPGFDSRPAEFVSWGKLPGSPQPGMMLWNRTDPLPAAKSLLPYGRGRSYGDSCLNSAGVVLGTARLDRFIAFDTARGSLTCEAGTTLADIIDCCLPKGWFPRVVPGTQYVSVGGAIANDVHGKNHHLAGTFGSHVVRFELLRSDGERRMCSAVENGDLFRATIGGLGLTGLITWAELALRKVASAMVEVEDRPFSSLEEFASLSAESDREFEYTVGWFDCYSYHDGTLRGVLSRGRHIEVDDGTLSAPRPVPRLAVPFTFPQWVLGRTAMRAFNTVYHTHKLNAGRRRMRLEPFLFPLDAVRNWNRLYGRDGFMQLQCVLPESAGMTAIGELLALISRRGQGSFLAVLKRFGDRPSPGMLSFPLPGVAIALDLPNRDTQSRALLAESHALVSSNGGRIYPAKDACMTPNTFVAGFPEWRAFQAHVDVGFSSNLWRRVTMDPARLQ